MPLSLLNILFEQFGVNPVWMFRDERAHISRARQFGCCDYSNNVTDEYAGERGWLWRHIMRHFLGYLP